MTSDVPVIAVMNHKGGVGKTTTTLALAEIFGKRYGRRVLAVDNDPQGSLSTAVGLIPPFDHNDTWSTLYEDPRKATDPQLAIVAREELGFWILPTDDALAGADNRLAMAPKREYRMAINLGRLLETYGFDLILVDCPPSKNILTLNALIASTHVLVPMVPDFLAVDGTAGALNTLEEIREWYPEASPGFLGVVAVSVEVKSAHHREMVERAKLDMGDMFLPVWIPKSMRAKSLPGQTKKTVLHLANTGWGRAYLALAVEVGVRLGFKESSEWDAARPAVEAQQPATGRSGRPSPLAGNGGRSAHVNVAATS